MLNFYMINMVKVGIRSKSIPYLRRYNSLFERLKIRLFFLVTFHDPRFGFPKRIHMDPDPQHWDLIRFLPVPDMIFLIFNFSANVS
jgi:hypothetical protein